jgi:hypothetical protein
MLFFSAQSSKIAVLDDFQERKKAFFLSSNFIKIFKK